MSTLFFNFLKRDLPSTKVKDSELHGKGLFAAVDIPAWTIVTTYPVHFVCADMEGQAMAYGETEGALLSTINTYKLELQPNDNVNKAGVPYKISISADPRVHFNTDPDPFKNDGLGHFINDSGRMTALTTSELKSYIDAFDKKANCIFYHVGTYGIAVVTTKPVKKNSELLCAYGVGYWCQGDEYKKFLEKEKTLSVPFYAKVKENLDKCADVLKKYEDHVQAMDKINFLMCRLRH